MSSVVKGVEAAMTAGELPLSLITKNVQISITSALVSGIGGTVLATPSKTLIQVVAIRS